MCDSLQDWEGMLSFKELSLLVLEEIFMVEQGFLLMANLIDV